MYVTGTKVFKCVVRYLLLFLNRGFWKCFWDYWRWFKVCKWRQI